MNKGFISIVSIIVFNSVLALSIHLLMMLTLHLHVIDAMKQMNEQVSEEALLIEQINCKLINEVDVNGYYSINGKNCYVERINDHELRVNMNNINFILKVDTKVIEMDW